jgi:hypothetical protein
VIRAHLQALHARRQLLIARAAAEREALGAALTVRVPRSTLVLGAGALAVLVALRPRAALRWLVRGYSAWRFYRSVRAAL